jgi:hypothetical protein
MLGAGDGSVGFLSCAFFLFCVSSLPPVLLFSFVFFSLSLSPSL